MGFLFPFIGFEFGTPDGLRLRTDKDVTSEAFEFLEVSAVNKFVVMKGGGGEKEHGAKVKGWGKDNLTPLPPLQRRGGTSSD